MQRTWQQCWERSSSLPGDFDCGERIYIERVPPHSSTSNPPFWNDNELHTTRPLDRQEGSIVFDLLSTGGRSRPLAIWWVTHTFPHLQSGRHVQRKASGYLATGLPATPPPPRLLWSTVLDFLMHRPSDDANLTINNSLIKWNLPE